MCRNGLMSILVLCWLSAAIVVTPAISQETGTLDTRVLIDISGSMKKNDPAYLRRSALRLLVELLPNESRAGIWTFGQYVNMQVPLGKVDDAWKRRGRKGAAKIHSRGLFTHIEEALRISTADWSEVTSGGMRHLILLTDGMVDVSKEPGASDASRERIVNELLPLLQSLGVRVHTIALSARADHELMKRLSKETDGWYEQVDTADRLQRVFMRLFEKVGRPDAVPLVENTFKLDKSIAEATLLVFRGEGEQPVRVTDPSGATFGAREAPPNIKWHRDDGYDLLTITDPQPGEWQVLAEIDPDNRVLVVTDLQMRATEFPGRVAIGESLPLSVSFSEAGKQITERSFLELINMQVVQRDAVGAGEPQPLFDDGKGGDRTAGDGVFSLGIETHNLEPGVVELTLSAEGRTFERQQKQTFKLVPWYRLTVDRGKTTSAIVHLAADSEILQKDSARLIAQLVSRTGEIKELSADPLSGGEGWVVEADPALLQGNWQMALNLSAVTAAGNKLEIALEPLIVEGTALPPPPPTPPPVVEEVMVEDDENWIDSAMIFAAANLAILALSGLAFWLLRRRGRNEIRLIDESIGA